MSKQISQGAVDAAILAYEYMLEDLSSKAKRGEASIQEMKLIRDLANDMEIQFPKGVEDPFAEFRDKLPTFDDDYGNVVNLN